jgi:hypothetical protein
MPLPLPQAPTNLRLAPLQHQIPTVLTQPLPSYLCLPLTPHADQYICSLHTMHDPTYLHPDWDLKTLCKEARCTPSPSTFSYYSSNTSREESESEALERQLTLLLILNRDTTSERAACDIKFKTPPLGGTSHKASMYFKAYPFADQRTNQVCAHIRLHNRPPRRGHNTV